jgi:hypothetical protein
MCIAEQPYVFYSFGISNGNTLRSWFRTSLRVPRRKAKFISTVTGTWQFLLPGIHKIRLLRACVSQKLIQAFALTLTKNAIARGVRRWISLVFAGQTATN